MKLTNREIFGARESLVRLMGERFPVKVSYGLAKLAGNLNPQLQVIEDVRLGLVKTYGEADQDNPNQTKVDPAGENYPKFLDELNELLDQEVEIACEKVKLPEKVVSTCEKCKHSVEKLLEVEPNILLALDKFVEV